MNKGLVHYGQIAELHYRGISEGFLSSLGQSFLALLYEAIDRSDEAVLITEERGGAVVGFIAGASSLSPLYKELMRRPLKLGMALAPALINPLKAWGVIELIYQGLVTTDTDTGRIKEPIPSYELLSIAVATDQRRSGVAKRLYRALVAHSARVGVQAFKIVVGENLEDAHRFYLQMGAVPASTVKVHGRATSIVYVQVVE